MTPLGHIRLLDLSRQLPGPFCSTLLGDLGMDVLVVGAPNDPFGTGIPFLARNKRSMTLNLKSDSGREIFLRLVAEADVVLEGFRPGVMDRLGVGWETLRATNPRLVYCGITGYGQDGPYRDRVGHDVNYLGYAGVLGFIGEPDGRPVIPGVQIADLGGGALMAAVGILSALIAREKTGRGQLVDVAMMDGAVAWNAYPLLLHILARGVPGAGGTQLTGQHPCYAVYETRDGRYVTIGAYEDHFWAELCRRLGREDFIPHQWDTGEKREEMFAFFRSAFRERTLTEWRRELEEAPICFGPVNRIEEMIADPQVRHRGMIVGEGDGLMPAPPIRLSDTPASIRTAPARFGEHTEEVLRGLGFAEEQIAALRAAGAV